MIIGSEVLEGTADILLLGQSFTVSKPIEISSVEVYAKRIGGGSSFQIYLQPYDPWTGTRGSPLVSKSVPLVDIPSNSEGGWVRSTFDNPISITDTGVYAIFVDSDSDGSPDGYNDFGYASGDSITGGRLIGPNFGSEVEMLFRIRGSAGADAFAPPGFEVPEFTSVTSELRYTAFGTFTFVRFSWDTESGAVYRILRSSDLNVWRDNNNLRLGDNSSTYSELSNRYNSKQFIKVLVQPLGEFKR